MPCGGIYPIKGTWVQPYLDPVFQRGQSWFFWTETCADEMGPYETEAEARKKLDEYVDWLEHGDETMRAAGEGEQAEEAQDRWQCDQSLQGDTSL